MALVAGVALAALAGFVLPAHAQRGYGYPYGYGYGSGYGWNNWYAPRTVAPPRKFRPTPSRRETVESQPQKDAGFGDMPKGPLQLVVSIDHQKVTLFSNGVPVAQGPVSTGVPGHPTPTGVFSIIEKDRYHRSNLYSNAPMPFMQRITWSGVALHEGVLPGYPASHGCIRMSHDFARKLWPVTKLGVRVVVARGDLAPVAFAHPKLFVPKPKPPEPAVAMNPSTNGLADRRFIAVAQAAMPDAGIDAPAADVPAAKPAPDTSEERKVDETAATSVEATKPAEDLKAAESPSPAPGDADQRKSAETRPSSEPASTPAVTAEPKAIESAPAANDLDKPAPAADPAKPVAPRMKAVDQPAKRSGQVAVFISRKENRLFVRQGFIPLFDMPVVIDEPDHPLGTHVFTAMAVTDEGAGMRWYLITFPTDGSPPVDETAGRRRGKEQSRPAIQVKPLKAPSTAAQALDRIQLPKEAVDRIGELLIPGSSLVVSDEGLGRETGRYTEFIVLGR